MQAEVTQQSGWPEKPQHQNSEGYDDDAADDIELIAIGQKHLPKHRCARAHEDEYGREAQDKTTAKTYGRKPARDRRGGRFVRHRMSGDVGHVTRHKK